MNFEIFEQVAYELIAKEMGTTPEAVRDDFAKFSAKIDRLIEEGYKEEEAEFSEREVKEVKLLKIEN